MHLTAPSHWSRSVGTGGRDASERVGAITGMRRRITLGIGDVVSVTIFEAEAGGLFLPSEAGARPGNFVTLPDQIVDSDGNITVPYAGTIRAAGRTPLEVQQAIIEALTRR